MRKCNRSQTPSFLKLTSLPAMNRLTSSLKSTVMSLELQLVDQLEDIFKDFERNISDMVERFIEFVQGIYPLSNKAKQKCFYFMGKASLTLTHIRTLLVDKDTVTNAVSASHYTHLQKIDDRENELLARINSWKSSLLKSIRNDEVERNRKRISEIQNYIASSEDTLVEKKPERRTDNDGDQQRWRMVVIDSLLSQRSLVINLGAANTTPF
ncbi:unnamed protein product [Leuciscus chuanchicus]